MNYRFGHCFLDNKHHQLWVHGEQVAIEARNFLLLRLLVEHGGQTLSRQELLEKLWPEQVVSDWSLARLVSDTRKLIGDDGRQQALIKTCRGGGFCLAVEVTEEQVLLLPKRSGMEKKKLFYGSLSAVVFALIWLVVWQWQGYQERQVYKVILIISQQLDITQTAFIAQLKRRNELGDMLDIKPIDGRIYWEKALSKAYSQGLNDEQRFVFDQIRAITVGALYQGNSKIYQLLQEHPEVKQEISSMLALERHLSFWLAKYREVFSKRQDMCLLYAGVEDGVPFPSTIDGEVAAWLAERNTCNLLFGC